MREQPPPPSALLPQCLGMGHHGLNPPSCEQNKSSLLLGCSLRYFGHTYAKITVLLVYLEWQACTHHAQPVDLDGGLTFPKLVLNLGPPDLHLLSTWSYRKPLRLAESA
jgi:hypothetical protein